MVSCHLLLSSSPHGNPCGLLLSRRNERLEMSPLIKQQTCHYVFTQWHVFAAFQLSELGQNFQLKSFFHFHTSVGNHYYYYYYHSSSCKRGEAAKETEARRQNK